MSKPSSTNSPRLSFSGERVDISEELKIDNWELTIIDSLYGYVKVTLSKSNILKEIKVVIALGIHLFPFRTEKLSPTTSMVLRKSGRVDSRRFIQAKAER